MVDGEILWNSGKKVRVEIIGSIGHSLVITWHAQPREVLASVHVSKVQILHIRQVIESDLLCLFLFEIQPISPSIFRS